MIISKLTKSLTGKFYFTQTKIISRYIFTSNRKLESIKKYKSNKKNENDLSLMNVVAYCSAEEYNLEELQVNLKKKENFSLVNLDDDLSYNVLTYDLDKQHNTFTKNIFFFRDGTVIFWNLNKIDIKQYLEFLKDFELKPYKSDIVEKEKEVMDFRILKDIPKSKFQKGIFYLKENSEQNIYEKYAFSNAIALSVKLSIWEEALNSYKETIKFISADMKEGKKINLTRHEVFKKTGDLFTLRHKLNLSSDLLDTPDFYWDRLDLENIYTSTTYFLNIAKRTNVMNEKLNHCVELIELVSNHLNEKHHVRLEWMIIILIMVEVGFEFLHYI